MPIWNLTEKQTRIAQSIGLALLGGAALCLVLFVVAREIFTEAPWMCETEQLGRVIFPREGHCPATEVSGGVSRIESGTIDVSHDKNYNLLYPVSCPEGVAGMRGHVEQHIPFSKPFRKPPKVVIAINNIDQEVVPGEQPSVNNLRVNASVMDISINGFHYNLNSWCKTKIHRIGASWIAYGN